MRRFPVRCEKQQKVKRVKKALSLLLCVLYLGQPARAQTEVLRTDNIYADQTALIPDAVVAANGDIIVTFTNHGDVQPGTQTLFVRSADGGSTWSDVYLTYDVPNTAENGVMVCGLFRRDDDSLLAYRVEIHMPGGELHKHQTAKIEILRSTDHGHTFEPIGRLAFPEAHLAAPYGPMIRLADGSIIMPGFIQNVGNGYWQSRDEGKTWGPFRRVWNDPPRGTDRHLWFNETAYEVLEDGTIFAVARNDFNELFYSIESKDNGRTWSEPRAMNIVGGSPALHLTADGRLLLAYRDGSRLGLAISESSDDGENWRYLCRLPTPEGVPPLANPRWQRPEQGTLWQPGEGNVGYPALVDLPDGKIYVVWHVHNTNSPPAAPGRATFSLAGNLLSNPSQNDGACRATVFPAAQIGTILRAQALDGEAGVAPLVRASAGTDLQVTPLRLENQRGGRYTRAETDRVVVVLGGEATLEVEGSPDQLIAEGDVAIVPAGERYRIACPDGFVEVLLIE